LAFSGSIGPSTVRICAVATPSPTRTIFTGRSFAGARELGWDGERVYRFATEKLALKTAVASLKELGPVQLKALAGFIQREVRAVRASRELAGAAKPR